jgi:hypothetical protein
MVTPQLEQTRKAKRQSDLEETQRVVTDRLSGRPVTAQELEWAKSIGQQEKNLEEAETKKALEERGLLYPADHRSSPPPVSSESASGNNEDIRSYSGNNAANDALMWDDDLGGVQDPAPMISSRAPSPVDSLDLSSFAGGHEDDAEGDNTVDNDAEDDNAVDNDAEDGNAVKNDPEGEKDKNRKSSSELSEVSNVSALVSNVSVRTGCEACTDFVPAYIEFRQQSQEAPEREKPEAYSQVIRRRLQL